MGLKVKWKHKDKEDDIRSGYLRITHITVQRGNIKKHGIGFSLQNPTESPKFNLNIEYDVLSEDKKNVLYPGAFITKYDTVVDNKETFKHAYNKLKKLKMFIETKDV